MTTAETTRSLPGSLVCLQIAMVAILLFICHLERMGVALAFAFMAMDIGLLAFIPRVRLRETGTRVALLFYCLALLMIVGAGTAIRMAFLMK